MSKENTKFTLLLKWIIIPGDYFFLNEAVIKTKTNVSV